MTRVGFLNKVQHKPTYLPCIALGSRAVLVIYSPMCSPHTSHVVLLHASEQGLPNWSTVFYKNLAGTDRKWLQYWTKSRDVPRSISAHMKPLHWVRSTESGQLLYLDLTVYINVLNNSLACQFNNVDFTQNMTSEGSPIHQEAVVLKQQETFVGRPLSFFSFCFCL